MQLSNVPEKIYLQTEGAELNDDFTKLVGVSWCTDKINETDLEYVLALRSQQLEEAALKIVKELYKHHRYILKNLDVPNEDKNIFLHKLGISTENMDNH